MWCCLELSWRLWAWVVSQLSWHRMGGELLFRHMADGQGYPEVPVWQTFGIMDQQSQPQLSSLVPRIWFGIHGFIHARRILYHPGSRPSLFFTAMYYHAQFKMHFSFISCSTEGLTQILCLSSKHFTNQLQSQPISIHILMSSSSSWAFSMRYSHSR